MSSTILSSIVLAIASKQVAPAIAMVQLSSLSELSYGGMKRGGFVEGRGAEGRVRIWNRSREDIDVLDRARQDMDKERKCMSSSRTEFSESRASYSAHGTGWRG
jgi:hypothetical protein